MAKDKDTREQYKAVVERRRSSASGTHGKTKYSRKDRANSNRKAIKEAKED